MFFFLVVISFVERLVFRLFLSLRRRRRCWRRVFTTRIRETERKLVVFTEVFRGFRIGDFKISFRYVVSLFVKVSCFFFEF